MRAAKAEDEDSYDEDAVLDPRAKALRDKQRELESDMKNAADLFGTDSSGTPHFLVDPCYNKGQLIPNVFVKFLLLDHVGAQIDVKSVLNANPKTKEEFAVLSRQIFELVIKRHQDKPLYAAFVEAHAKELANPLRDVEIKKVASGLTALANEKQKEAKDKGKSKKKPPKPVLGSSKALGKYVSDSEMHLDCSRWRMLMFVVPGLIQSYTTKLWTTSVTIQTISCELVKTTSPSSSTPRRSSPFVLNSAYVTLFLVVTVSTFYCIDTSTCVCNDKFMVISPS